MTEATAVEKVAKKSKLGSVFRSVILGAMMVLMLLLIIMAVYRKVAG
jgi:hypothetical protein